MLVLRGRRGTKVEIVTLDAFEKDYSNSLF